MPRAAEYTPTQRAVIITALPEEFLAVRRHLHKITTHLHQGTVYETGWLKGDPRKIWQVSIAEIGKGNPKAAMETERAIRYLKPDVALLVGVAGGLKDVAPGDVVAATKVYGYEFGKDANGFMPRPDVGNCSHQLEQMARSVARNSAWRKRVSAKSHRSPRARVGPIVAGEKVLADKTSELYAFIQRQYSDALAVEMEGIGFLTAAFANSSTSSMIVRGISDLIDRKEESDAAGWQSVAARNAASFASELLRSITADRIEFVVTIQAIVPEEELPSLLRKIHDASADPTITLRTVKRGSTLLYLGGTRTGYQRLKNLLDGGHLSALLGMEVSDVALAEVALESEPVQAFLREPLRKRVGRKPVRPDAEFFDDFSDPVLARYYEVTPGIGNVVRRMDGLHYKIARAPDGPSSAADYLSIDSLGRPQSPTAKVLFRFSGREWTLETCVDYDFRTKSNGRTAYLWLVQGSAEERYRESIALVRGADLEPSSHSLSLQVYEVGAAPRSIELARTVADKYWLRITRAGSRVFVLWSADGRTFKQVLERAAQSQSPEQTVVVNSSSFAGGASFIVRSLFLAGVRPDPVPERPPGFVVGPGVAEVPAADIVAALQAGRDIDLRNCAITGPLDLGQVRSPIGCNIRLQDCRFSRSLVATSLVRLTGSMSCFDCQFDVVGLSNVEFDGPLNMVACRFAADTRFIDTHFSAGANFTGSVFSEKPFFRVAHATRPVSFYHVTFAKGADLSSASFDDLSLSDIRVEDGSLTFYRSEVSGTLRLMTTLQRDPQPMGRELEFSAAQIACLVISAGDQRNRGEYTGPARWDLAPNVYLRRATVDRLEVYNVQFGGVLDLSGATLGSKDIYTASFKEVVGGWPVETEFYSCFISYSSEDALFASRLHAELEKNGVRCWFAPEDIKIGEEFRRAIDDAIREYDKLLLVLSENSVRSSWVQDEIEACLERERRQQRQVLFPIRLDTAVMSTRQAWAAAIRRRRHIGDFTGWRDPAAYMEAFQRLLRDLKAPAQTP